MIFVDLERLTCTQAWHDGAAALVAQLMGKPENERSAFIDRCRAETWGHPELIAALRSMVGNKCWYSEVPLDGADPNVDHFRPKGRVREIDDKCQPTATVLPGYWWWALEWRNFRLASMHSNQRRVDTDTDGGKADYFPVRGARAGQGEYRLCREDAIPLDPCKRTDVSLLWFDSDGTPSCSNWRRVKTAEDEFRVQVSIWLYHLNKQEIVARRREHMDEIRAELLNADSDYRLWKSIPGNIVSKESFEARLTAIAAKIAPESVFSGAKRAALFGEAAKYEWILEYILI